MFKAKCLAVMDEVHLKCESVIITKRGKPIAKLVPVQSRRDDIFGFMKDRLNFIGDVVTPVISQEEWEGK